MTYRLRRRESVEVALRRIALEQLDAMLEQAGRDAEHGPVAHAIRKRCKKARALLRIVHGSFDGYAREQRTLRDAARLLAPTREATAQRETLERLCDQLCDAEGGLALDHAQSLKRWLEASRTCRLDGVAHGEALAEVRTMLREQRDRIAGWTLDDLGFDAVREGLERTYRRGREAARAAVARPSPDALHELRKRVKYHRFHLALLRHAWPTPLSSVEAEARVLGDVLGDHHDAAVLIDALRERIEDHDIGPAAAHAVPLLEARMRELERRAHPLAARLFAEKSSAFTRRARAYWRAWRRSSSG